MKVTKQVRHYNATRKKASMVIGAFLMGCQLTIASLAENIPAKPDSSAEIAGQDIGFREIDLYIDR